MVICIVKKQIWEMGFFSKKIINWTLQNITWRWTTPSTSVLPKLSSKPTFILEHDFLKHFISIKVIKILTVTLLSHFWNWFHKILLFLISTYVFHIISFFRYIYSYWLSICSYFLQFYLSIETISPICSSATYMSKFPLFFALMTECSMLPKLVFNTW